MPTRLPGLTPLEQAVYNVDQLGLGLRDSMRLVTQQVGFFVGQQRYLDARQRVNALLEQYGAVSPAAEDPTEHPREATHQVGSP
jgi:hypothetical protein